MKDFTAIRKLAYWVWRELPRGTELEDVQQEACIGGWLAEDGMEVIAAKRAIFDYLRRWHRGSRQGRRVKTTALDGHAWTAANQERDVLSEEERQRVMRAVDKLTRKQLRAISAVFYRGMKQREAAAEMGINESQFSLIKTRALRRLALELAQ